MRQRKIPPDFLNGEMVINQLDETNPGSVAERVEASVNLTTVGVATRLGPGSIVH